MTMTTTTRASEKKKKKCSPGARAPFLVLTSPQRISIPYPRAPTASKVQEEFVDAAFMDARGALALARSFRKTSGTPLYTPPRYSSLQRSSRKGPVVFGTLNPQPPTKTPADLMFLSRVLLGCHVTVRWFSGLWPIVFERSRFRV